MMFKVALACIVALIGYLGLKVHRNYIRITQPETVADPFYAASSPGSVPDQCGIQQHVHNVEGIHTFEAVQEYIKGFYNAPVLFKKYSLEADKKWKMVLDMHQNDMLNFTNVDRTGFGNVFMRGIKTREPVTMTLGDIYRISESKDENHTSFFASFLPFLREETTKLLFSMNGNDYDSIKLDTNFVSNFVEDTLASSIHAAFPINSYALQLTGRKLWIFLHPKIFHRFNTFTVGPTIPNGGSEREMLKVTNGVYTIAVQEEGDLLYFPPQWAHAVVSKAGMNVMCNIRQPAYLKSFYVDPDEFIDGVAAAVIKKHHESAKGNYNYALVKGLQKRVLDYNNMERDGEVPDSPCVSTWKEMLAR